MPSSLSFWGQFRRAVHMVPLSSAIASSAMHLRRHLPSPLLPVPTPAPIAEAQAGCQQDPTWGILDASYSPPRTHLWGSTGLGSLEGELAEGGNLHLDFSKQA